MNAHPADNSYLDDAVPWRDHWRIIVRRRTFIGSLVGLTAIATALFIFLQPNIYQSTTTLMPLGTSRSGPSAALGELGGFLPLPSVLMGRDNITPSMRLLAVLQSRTLAMDVIERLHLLPILFEKKWDAEKQQWRTKRHPTLQEALRKLKGLVFVNASRQQGIITIAVSHTDAVLAATIANAYVDALQRALNENAFSLAKKNRLFIASQLEKTRQDLDSAEAALKEFEQTYTIIALEAQTKATVEATAAIEGQIRAREVQLGVHQRLLTGASREVYLLQEELQAWRAQRARLQHGSPAPRPVSNHQGSNHQAVEDQVWLSFDQAPDIKFHYARLQRETLVQNKLFAMLAQQLEQAKIDEARDETAFQLVDRAIPPERKHGPMRTLIVLLAVIASTVVGIMVALFREYADATIRTREQVQQAGLPLLVAMPAVDPQQTHLSATGSPVLQPSDPAVTEASRYLYTRLKQLHHGPQSQTIVCVGAGPDDDTGFLLAHLALVAASAGERTLLVDSNVRQPVLHSLLHCALTPGLADALATPECYQNVIQCTPCANLHLIAAGTVTPATYAALDSPALDALLTRSKETYDLILCAAPPALGVTDAAVLGSKIDATCLVLTCGVSSLDTVLEAKSVLEAVQANVIGAILLGYRP